MSLDPYVHVDATELASGTVVVPSDEVDHHLRRVLRLREGAAVVVASGTGLEADGVLVASGVQVTSPPRWVHEGLRVEVWQAVGKGGRTEDAVRMATEAGASDVVLVLAERTVRRLDAEKATRLAERCDVVARSAAAQSRRPRIPTVGSPSALPDLLRVHGADGVPSLVMHAAAPPLVSGTAAVGRLRQRLAQGDRVRVAIGPEGGWTAAERRLLTRSGWDEVALPTPVLRTEHAALAAVVALRTLVAVAPGHASD